MWGKVIGKCDHTEDIALVDIGKGSDMLNINGVANGGLGRAQVFPIVICQ